jgi:uncharacterized membrane protein YeaQ/YmgE (transglycosylase-associated protein family)
MGWLWTILIGLVAGWLTGKIMKGSGYGFFWDIILGIVGSLLGGWIASLLGMSAQGGLIWRLILALVGSIIIVFIFRLVTGKKA